MRTKKYFLMMIIAVSVFSIAAQRTLTAVDDIIGMWKYTISNVPPEYESGFFIFEQNENKLTGYAGQAEKQQMQDLTVDQGKVTFATSFDGGLIKYSLTQKGDTLSGTVSTQYGDFPVTAVKEIKK